eukprot:4282134-Pyramimonas_sp.AAC.1
MVKDSLQDGFRLRGEMGQDGFKQALGRHLETTPRFVLVASDTHMSAPAMLKTPRTPERPSDSCPGTTCFLLH